MSQILRDIINANPNAASDQIAAICAADKRTVRAVTLATINPWLGKSGRSARITDIPNYIEDATQKAQASIRVRSFVAYTKCASNSTFDLNDPEVAAESDPLLALAQTVYAASSGLAGLSADECGQIIDFGGGYAVANVTAADVDAEKRGIAADSLIAQVKAWEEAAKQTTANTAATFISQVETWRDTGAGDAPVFNLT